jgi:hypothetical protein
MEQPPKSQGYGFWYRNSLSIVFLVLMAGSLVGQIYTGWQEHNDFLKDHRVQELLLFSYLGSGHFLQSTFENWESEFLQMALFVILTIFLRQIGSSESKELGAQEEEDDELPKPGSPWPVKKGGWILMLYKHSLSISLLLLFAGSFMVHWYGSWVDFNEQQLLEHKPTEQFLSYLHNKRFWFESFQNWQSEFLSVFAIVFLSIYLRQTGSPQSKPVNAPHDKTGEG